MDSSDLSSPRTAPAPLRFLAAALLLAACVLPAVALLQGDGETPAAPAPGGLRALPPLPALHFPRDVDVGPDGHFYVVDRTASVHRISPEGRLVATLPMPDRERGNPQGLCVAPDGRLLVADTHYSRVTILSPDGRLLGGFGRYGKGPGEFIYPVSVAIGSEGRIYVGEYGGEDRVQVFRPDGSWLFAFGASGEEPGRFRRPSGLCLGPGSLLYVADACNHRVQAFDADGRFVRAFGAFGSAPGCFHYPFDVDATPEGTLVVSEYGNNRIQELAPDGRSLRCLGRAGAGEGELHSPWGIAAGPGGVVVADTWNHRLQVWGRTGVPPGGTVPRVSR